MATPHLAGSAAIVRQQHPGWSASDVRSAIVNTADSGVLRDYLTGALQNNVNIVGTGRENLFSAVNAKAGLDPVSLSFGAVPSGSGQTMTGTITVTNLSGSSQTYSFAVTGQPLDSVTYSVAPATLTLAAGAKAEVTVTMSAVKGAIVGGKQAILSVTAGGTEVGHAALFSLIK
jgi:subtilisin family serine protease